MSDRLTLEAFIATDRLQAMAQWQALPTVMQGALAMVDLTGYTGSVEQAERQLGATRGADVMTKAINRIFDRLICEIYRYGGVVVGFSGDAILAWFLGDHGLQATASAFAMQQSVAQQAEYPLGSTLKISFVLKASIATGKVQRCVVGDTQIQQFDLLTGEAMNKLILVQQVTKGADIVLGEACAEHLKSQIHIKDWIVDQDANRRFAIVDRLTASGTLFDQPTLHSLPTQQLAPWILRPVYENLLATNGQFSASIRQVVALFFKFHLSEAILAQDCGSEIDHYVCWVQRTLRKQNGYLIKLTIDDKGCYCLATFGAPQDSEDASQRALTAALALRNPPSHLAFGDAMQIGISQGRMLAGSFGNQLRAGYDLLGHDLTIANRLMMRARAGEILVTEQVAANCERFFKFQHLGSEMVKGSQQPVSLFLLLATQLEIPFDLSKITIGREVELNRLQEFCQSLPTSGLRAVRLVGPAGIGKTQLLLEMHRRVSQWGVQSLLADCERVTQRVAYYPWRQILQQLLRMISHEVRGDATFEEIEAVLLHQLGNRFEESTIHAVLTDIWGRDSLNEEEHLHGKAQERHATIAALIAALLHDQLALQPVIITIEDVQWLDLPSFELLLNLKRTLAESPLLLLVSHRPLDESRSSNRLAAALQQVPDSTEIEINAFELSATEQLIESHLGGTVAPLLHALLHAQTQGNPLALEEAIRTHQITGRIQLGKNHSQWTLSPQAMNELRQAHCLEIDPESGEWQLKVNAALAQAGFGTPDRLQQMIFARFDLLNAELQLTLKVASVIGRSFNLSLLQASHPMQLNRSTLRNQLAKLRQQHFLTSQSSQSSTIYRFQHQLIQEGIYESMPLDEQVALHYAVGNGLATQAKDELEQLAWHFWRCRAEYPEEALQAVKQAAQQAQNHSNHTALDFYNQALQLAPEDVVGLQGKIEASHVLGDRVTQQEALAKLQNVADTQNDQLLLSTSYLLWGDYYHAIADFDQAEKFTKQAAATCLVNESRQRIRCFALLGLIEWRRGDYENSLDYYQKALQLIPNNGGLNKELGQLMVQVLNGLAIVYRQMGNYQAAEESAQRALTKCRLFNNLSGESETLTILGGIAFYQRQLDSGIEYQEQSLYIRRKIGDRAGEATSLCNLALAYFEKKQYVQVTTYLDAALPLLAVTKKDWEQVNALNLLGALYYQLNDLPKAIDLLAQGQNIAQKIGATSGEAYILCNQGMTLRDMGAYQAAENKLANALQLAQTLRDKYLVAMCKSHLGLLYLACNNPQLAIKYATRALVIRRSLQSVELSVIDLTTLAVAYALMRKTQVSLKYIDRAIILLEQCKAEGPEFPHRDYFIIALLLARTGEIAKAQYALDKAFRLLMTQVDSITDPIVRDNFIRHNSLNQCIIQVHESSDANALLIASTQSFTQATILMPSGEIIHPRI